MNPNTPKIELNSLNTGKLGVEQSMMRDGLKKAVVAYMDHVLVCRAIKLRKDAGEKIKYPKPPVTLRKIQSLQSAINKRRKALGIPIINEIIDLRIWKRAVENGEFDKKGGEF